MYFPYFRGKQFELMAIRETASIMAQSNIVPIIEPVKSSFNPLIRALDEVRDNKGSAVLIMNPSHGEFASDPSRLRQLFTADAFNPESFSAGLLLTEHISLEHAQRLCDSPIDLPLTLIYSGFTEGRALATYLDQRVAEIRHVFLNESERLKRYLRSGQRILVKDGFEKRANKDHPDVEFFSDLHVTYSDLGMNGFGDFLIVGDEYSESGGPAYAVAIHLTYIDDEEDDDMYIRHFKSIRNDSPTDPAGKFAEALAELVSEVQRQGTKILNTTAVQEFVRLHATGHFPGLGYVKKLSMKHHIETLADYIST